MAKKKRGKSTEGLFIMFGGAILFALGGSATNILAQALMQTGEGFQWYTIFELPFGIFWFLFGGTYAHLWVFLGFWMMAAFNISSLPYYQGGFQKGKILIMYPILDSIALLLPITAGLLVFKQTFSNFPLFFIALICSVFATIVLSKYQAAIETMDTTETNKDKEDNEPTKQPIDLE
jgi:multidrug transporter EmrE-like cation transporter